MREVLVSIRDMYASYNGSGMHLALFFACILYLIVNKKEKEKRYLFVGYTLLFFILAFFPLTAKVIMKLLDSGENVYWRIFWLLPVGIVIAYTAVQIIVQMETKVKRYLILFIMLVMIALTGKNVYNTEIFDREQNHYKLPQDAIDICNIIEADALENKIEKKKLITVNDLVSSIRQYDADIFMPYGYAAIKGSRTETTNAGEIFRIMSSENKNWEALSWYAAMEECNYLAYPIDEGVAAALEGLGYEKVGSNASYYVYRRNLDAKAYNDNWLITQYGSAEGSQLSFYTLQDKKGHLIVVDGGWTTDADYVRQVLNGLGNKVDAWFISHPHRDHAGAFVEIYKNPGKLKIKKVYATDMAPIELCLENAPWDETEVYEEWVKLDILQLEYVYPGDRLEIAGLDIEVLHAYDDYVDELSNDLLNDGSMMLKMTAKEESMLFCSDVGKKMSEYLLTTCQDDLKADYIQMGHHGNGGLSSEFYKNVEAKAAFFDSPEWLMHDTSGNYTTPKNMYLMSSNGAAIYSFSTTPNQIILK